MAKVVKCPDCGGKVSVRAMDCPHCGCPMDEDEDDSGEVQASKPMPPPPPVDDSPRVLGVISTRKPNKRDMATGCAIGCLVWPTFLAVVGLLEWLFG